MTEHKEAESLEHRCAELLPGAWEERSFMEPSQFGVSCSSRALGCTRWARAYPNLIPELSTQARPLSRHLNAGAQAGRLQLCERSAAQVVLWRVL